SLSSGTTPAVDSALWGPKEFDVSGTLVVVNDACAALAAPVTGKIAVVDRGNCTFKTKALNVQNAGGVGMVLVNDAAGSAPSMGEDTTILQAITVGALSVSDADGAQIKTEIAAGNITATLRRKQSAELDGSLDSTLIAHEFGHYIHHRLSYCVTKMCQAMS